MQRDLFNGKTYEDVFGGRPAVRASAPGRVNVLGEHTDYNEGFVLPIATTSETVVTLGYSEGPEYRAYSANLDRLTSFALDCPPLDPFARYVFGCLRVLADTGVIVPPLNVHVTSDVPIGVGLSSSAALEVAVLRAVRQALGVALDDVRIALLAQQAEIEHAGVRCGVMDQMAASLSDGRHMLFLDTRTLQFSALPLPPGSELLVLDSGVSRRLATAAYNRRREECHAAAAMLAVAALRDVSDMAQVESLPEPLRRRARHVVSENGRVLEARGGVDADAFGALMNASHDSLRDDFEVSHPAVDTLVALLRLQGAIFGARMTGAGFGGACVALCHLGTARDVGSATLASYAAVGGRGRLLEVAA